MNGRRLSNCNAEDYIGKDLSGVSGQTFPISAAGLLAASHRMGSGKVCNYLRALDKPSQGNYSMNYQDLDPNQDREFRAIETRMRQFAR